MSQVTDIQNDHNADHIEELTREVQQIWPGFHHKILGKLGEGGCGRTLKILWTLSRKPAVLKYLLSAASAARRQNPEATFNNLKHAQWQRLLEQEATVLWAFREFEAAVTPLELHSSFVGFVMEFVPAGNLLGNLDNGLDWREKVRRLLPVVELLSAMQNEGIYHRDLALDNLFLTENQDLKLGDFGLLHNIDAPIVPLVGCGKPGYFHPDIKAFRKQPDAFGRLRNDLQDVYAICICLMSWVKGLDPNTQKSRNWLREGYPELSHALDPFLFPSGHYPDFATGIGSFQELFGVLTKVAKAKSGVQNTAPVKSTPSRISPIEETFSSMQHQLQHWRNSGFSDGVDSDAVISGSPVLSWEAHDGLKIRYGFVTNEVLQSLINHDPAWPEAPLVNPSPFPGDIRIAGTITWDQAFYLARHFDLKLPSLHQARHIPLPGTALTQIWTSEDCDGEGQRFTLIENNAVVREKIEFRGSTNPYRVCCLVESI